MQGRLPCYFYLGGAGMAELTTRDYEMLHEIYLLRCLSESQIYIYFYKDLYKGIEDMKDNIIQTLLDDNIICEEKLIDSSVYFLMRKGIDLIVSRFNKPLNIIDEQSGKIKKGYYTASELKLNTKLIKHQVYLNQFVLDFKALYNYYGMNELWEYYDEKYVSQYSKIRPDGMLRIGNRDLFLEMDMNTENYQQLCEKWKKYNTFLHTPEFRNISQNILIIFIIDGTNDCENRKKIVQTSINETIFSDISGVFDIIVGTRTELLCELFKKIIPDITHNNLIKAQLYQVLTEIHNFQISDTSYFYRFINGWNYGFYVRQTDKDNHIAIKNNMIQAYFIDFYYRDLFSNISKIKNYKDNLTLFNSHYNWIPSYIIVCDESDLTNLKDFLELTNTSDKENVIYVTTLKRLSTYTFQEALIPLNLL